jgi:diguanylate cyclase (GGDEF)-like protein
MIEATDTPLDETGLRRFVAEFPDRELERRFLADESLARTQFARVACLVFVAAYTTLAIVDVTMVPKGPELVTLLAVRFLCIVPAIAMAAGMAGGPRAISGELMTTLEIVLLGGNVALAAFEPEGGAASHIGMAVILMAVLTLGTNRVSTRFELALMALAGWVAVGAMRLEDPASVLAPEVVMLLVVVGVGLVAGQRLESVQRREWALREGERELNIRLSAEIRRRERIERDLLIRANVDGLTGVPNRRHFLELAAIEYKRAQRNAQPLSLVVLDVDHFKAINDEHGHAAGDEVLRRLGAVLREHVRRIDVIGRIGGEEFALMMPGADTARAGEVVERICSVVRDETILLPNGQARLTISAGVAEADVWAESIDDGLARADAAMYRAKYDGRDRVVVAGLGSPT